MTGKMDTLSSLRFEAIEADLSWRPGIDIDGLEPPSATEDDLPALLFSAYTIADDLPGIMLSANTIFSPPPTLLRTVARWFSAVVVVEFGCVGKAGVIGSARRNRFALSLGHASFLNL